ncbi:5105_t:CDS:1, partial [Cetraspora pellucida]
KGVNNDFHIPMRDQEILTSKNLKITDFEISGNLYYGDLQLFTPFRKQGCLQLLPVEK